MMKAVLLLIALSAGLLAADVKQSAVAGNVSTHTMTSESLGGIERKVNVALPADYNASQARYPVLYLLHGYGDDQSAWSYMTNVALYAARHRVIVAMPDGGVSFYINSVSDPAAKYEDYIAKDLVSFVDSKFRTIPLPRARAIAGLSMGGYGAAFLGLKHANRFSALGAFSGALAYATMEPRPGNTDANRRFAEQLIKNLGPVGGPARAERDAFALVEKIDPATAPMIYVACGGQDFLIESNREFIKALAKKKIPYEYREVSPRGHTWDFWDDSLRVFLGLLDHKPGWKVD